MINIINLSLDIIQVQALSLFSVFLLARGTALFVLAAVFVPIKVSNIWFLMPVCSPCWLLWNFCQRQPEVDFQKSNMFDIDD